MRILADHERDYAHFNRGYIRFKNTDNSPVAQGFLFIAEFQFLISDIVNGLIDENWVP